MKRLLFSGILFCIPFLAMAQSRQLVDSIKNVLKNTKSDSIKYRGYADLSFAYATTMVKTDSADMYADSIYLYAKARNDQRGLALANYHFGVANRFKGEMHQGIEQMQKFIDYHTISKDTAELAKGLYQIGVMNLQVGAYEKSLEQLQKSHDLYKRSGDKRWEAVLLHSMAHIYRKLNKYEDAIKNYKEAIAIKKQLNDSTGLSMSTESLGNTFGEMGNYVESEKYLKEALKIVRGENRPYGIASVTENLGNTYNRMGKHTAALEYHLESLELRRQMSNKRALVLGLLKIGQTHWALQNYGKSQEYLLQSLNQAKEIGVKPLVAEAYKSLSLLYESKGDLSNAYHFLKQYESLNDSLLNEEKNRQLVEMQTKYDVKQKEQEIQLLAKENELQMARAERESTIKNGLLIGLVLVAIISALIFYVFRQKLRSQSILAKKNEELRFSQFREELSSLEMKALRAQMNPHFLFNCMNSINRMIMGNENDKASSYLGKFSKLVRSMLQNSEEAQVTLKDELQMLESYIELESIRFKNKIVSQFSVEESIDQENILIPSMVLQPFVENAIWHGLMHKEGKGKIEIDIKVSNDTLICTITDNGIGRQKSLEMQNQYPTGKKSMGIKITTNRLTMLTRKKTDEVIKITDLKDENDQALGTRVQVLIPIH